MRWFSAFCALVLGLILFMRLAWQPAYAAPNDAVIGDGTPASCDGDAASNALEAAVLSGGLVTFDCGGAHTIIANTMYMDAGLTTTIDGGGVITISGDESRQIFIVAAGASLTLKNITLSNGAWDGNGGAIVVYGTAALDHTTVRESYAAGIGGAIAVESGNLTLAHSQILVNRASVAGGGIGVNGGSINITDSTINDNEAGYGNRGVGGGIFNRGDVTIQGTGFNANRAHDGAALYNEGADSRLTVEQTTLSYNEAFRNGGAMFIYGGAVVVDNTTVSGNAAHSLAGGIHFGIAPGTGNALLRAVTLYGNTVVNVDNVTTNANLHVDAESEPPQIQNTIVQGTVDSENCYMGVAPVSLGYNQATDASCGFTGAGDQENATVTLAPLADNGGPTRTHLAIEGSSTVDAIPPESCAVSVDQRAFGRPQGPNCDAGAVEGIPTTMPPLPVSQPYFLGNLYVRPFKLPIFALKPNIEATQLEITQGIQEADGLGVTLVSGKRTFVRFHVRKTLGAADPVVGARLWRIVGGQRVGDPLMPSAQVNRFRFVPYLLGGHNYVFDPTVTVRSNPDRNSLTDSFFFLLPREWTTGNLTVEAEVNPTFLPNAVDELTRSDNTLRTSFSFADTPTMVLRLFSVLYRNNGTTYASSETQLREVEDWLRRAYPIAGLVVRRDTEDMTNLNRIPTCDEVNGRLFWDNLFLKWAGIDPVPTRYFGLVADGPSGNPWMRGCAADIPSFIASGPTGDPKDHSFSIWDKDNDGQSFGDWYTGHELAHTWGRSHVNCRGDEVGPDMSYPMGESGSIGRQGGQNKYWGFDVMLRGPVVYPPTWKDVMTYCNNQWISAYTYEAIRNKLVAENAAARAYDLSTAPLADYLVVQGTLTPAGPSATLEQVYRLTTPLVLAPTAPGPYAIRLVDGGGNALAVYPFTPRVDTEDPGNANLPQLVMEQVPYVAGTAAVQIVSGATVLDERLVSPHAPVVTVDTPGGGEVVDDSGLAVSWTATDEDGGDLVATVLYSRDGGATYAPLRLHLTESSVVIPLAELGGTTQGKVRVIVSDGVNTGQGDSAALFTVPDQPPVAQIVAPGDGEVFGYGQIIPLAGAATDMEDTTLPDASFRWTSDLDGELGVGATVAASLATVGTHAITLIVSDSVGAVGMDARMVVVSNDVMLATDALDAAPLATNFDALLGSTTVQTQSLSLRNPAENEVTWQAASNAPWLSVSPASGATPADPELRVNPSGLSAGDHVAVITFTNSGPGGALPDRTVRVTLTVVGPSGPLQRVYLPMIDR